MAKFKTAKVQAEPQRVYLKDYLPPEYYIRKVNLRFDIQEDHTLVTADSEVEANEDHPVTNGKPAALVLHGHDMDLIDVQVDGAKVIYDVDDKTLTIPNTPRRFRLKVVTRIEPHKNKALEGLYKSGDIYCTQCEAEGFRRITYFVDRPDNMAVFTTEIIADRKSLPVLLSNGNRVEARDLGDGRHYVRWEDPFKKPSYLFALVAGKLEHIEDDFTTRSGRKVVLQVYADPGRRDRCHHAMESLKKAMKWDEQRFGLEYDLDLFMIVAVDAFNMGAMENKGLNIFNSQVALADPKSATDDTYLRIESVIGHEYFHNWTGNRITCRDWFQLSLKEGLTVYRDQEFSADMFSAPVQRIDDVQTLRARQFQEDAGPNAHPVRPDSFVTIDNFYTTTIYEKGSELIRMIETIVGREGFRKGSDKYFELFDGMAVTTEDFVRAMEIANDVDLSQFRRWYTQAGTPVVRAEGRYDASEKAYCLTLSQACPPTPRQSEKEPFHIPVKTALIGADGGEIAGTARVLNLKERTETFRFENIHGAPVPSLLRDFSAPVRLEFDYTEEELKLLATHDPNLFNRWEAGQKLYLRTLLTAVTRLREGKDPETPEALLSVFGGNLAQSAQPSGDRLFASRLLRMPGTAYLGQFLDVIEPDLVKKARRELARAIAGRFEKELLAAYESNRVKEEYRPVPDQMGRRFLKNFCLGMLAVLEKPEHLKLAAAQYASADNMTDKVAALGALADIPSAERETVFRAFYGEWKADKVVFNTWLALESASDLPDALDRVKSLLNDPHVDRDNPNNMRSIISSFARNNEPQFHRADGRGYEWVADQVIAIDRRNPQMAARLAGAFDQWKRYSPARQELMKAQMSRILGTQDLSENTFEIVSNALNA